MLKEAKRFTEFWKNCIFSFKSDYLTAYQSILLNYQVPIEWFKLPFIFNIRVRLVSTAGGRDLNHPHPHPAFLHSSSSTNVIINIITLHLMLFIFPPAFNDITQRSIGSCCISITSELTEGIFVIIKCVNIYRWRLVDIMFIGPCIIAIVHEWNTNLMSLAVLLHFLYAQHVSDINISIFRSLRLCWGITTSVVLFSVRCV